MLLARELVLLSELGLSGSELLLDSWNLAGE